MNKVCQVLQVYKVFQVYKVLQVHKVYKEIGTQIKNQLRIKNYELRITND
jgi:hypothetical protein